MDGDRWVFIDWDWGLAPGSRLWDLAWTAQSFVPLAAGGDPAADAPPAPRAWQPAMASTAGQRSALYPSCIASVTGNTYPRHGRLAARLRADGTATMGRPVRRGPRRLLGPRRRATPSSTRTLGAAPWLTRSPASTQAVLLLDFAGDDIYQMPHRYCSGLNLMMTHHPHASGQGVGHDPWQFYS